MRIGLISDTHSFLDPTVLQHFESVDEIWHAGDIGSIEVIDELKSIGVKCRMVYGNIDPPAIRQITEEYWSFELLGTRFLLIHIAGSIGKYNRQVKNLIKNYSPDILICGHSHILKVKKDEEYDLLYVNPGAAGNQGFHKYRTLIRMELEEGRIGSMEAVELGRRGALK